MNYHMLSIGIVFIYLLYLVLFIESSHLSMNIIVIWIGLGGTRSLKSMNVRLECFIIVFKSSKNEYLIFIPG